MKRKNFGNILVLGALVLLLPLVAWAQSATPQINATPVVTTGGEMKSTRATETLNVQVDEGQLLRLPKGVNSIFVANSEIADVNVKSPQLVYIYGRRTGETTFYAVDSEDNIVASRRVVVGLNLGNLRSALNQLTGGNRISVSSVDDMIVLSGNVETSGEALDAVRLATRYLPSGATADNIINRLSVVGANQISLRVRIAEVNRTATKTFGLSSSVSNNSLFGQGGFSVGFESNITSLTGAVATAGLNNTWGATDFSTALEALVNDGMATVLAEPNLTAISGETASFLAGGEFPIIIPDSNGTLSVQFREFGVRLSFTPTIVNGDRISLRVRPEVSDRVDALGITLAGTTIPGLTTRRAETTVELGSGQSFAVAGLLSNDSNQAIDKYPGLGDLPIIGALFRSDSFRQRQSELVIIVTPYLVRPTSAQNVMVPTDGFVPPNDIDRWLNGRFNSETPTPTPVAAAAKGESAAAAGLTGDVGFTLQ